MRKISKALVATVVAGAMIVAISGPAHAGDRPGKPVNATSTGHFYVISQGAVYFNQGNAAYWPRYWANNNESMSNDGYVGGRDKVNVYWGGNYTGAYACMRPGDSWRYYESPGSYQTFFWTRNGDTRGLDQSVWWNAVSHRWVTYCGNNSW